MELLFAALGGAVLGFVAHFSLPGQKTRGALWAAGFGTCAAIVVWEALTLVGLTSGGGWIWVVTLVAAAATAAASCLLSAKRREKADADLLEALFRGKSA